MYLGISILAASLSFLVYKRFFASTEKRCLWEKGLLLVKKGGEKIGNGGIAAKDVTHGGLNGSPVVPSFALDGGGAGEVSEKILTNGDHIPRMVVSMEPSPSPPPEPRPEPPISTMPPPPRPPPSAKRKTPTSALKPKNPQPTLNPPPSRLQPTPTTTPLRLPPPTSALLSTSTLPPPSRRSKKVLLSPGHSPLDWAHLTAHPPSPTHLRGSSVPPHHLIRVTPALLRFHNGRKGQDAWGVWQGKVYNLTPYLDFHPGGRGELLRGAGKEKEGERLFLEVHPWVSWEGMLGECLVGILVGEGEGVVGGGVGGGVGGEGEGGGEDREGRMEEMD